MSTKKTRSALAMLGTIAGGSGIMRQAIQDALTEVEAIERAAKRMSQEEYPEDVPTEVWTLMDSIAKDAP